MADIVKPTFASAGTSNTLAGQITRIKNYVTQLGKEAAYLELQKIDGEAAAAVGENSSLEELTNAFLLIENKKVTVAGNAVELGEKDVEVTAGQVITVAKGYYRNDTSFKVQSLSDSSKVTNAPAIQDEDNSDEIVSGKEAWVNGKMITGTLADYSKAEDKNITPTSTTKATAANDTEITLAIAEGKYGAANVIKTGIIAKVPTEPYKPEIVKTTDKETGATLTAAEGIEIPAGYYNSPIKVIPVFKDIEGNVEDTINTTEFTVEGPGTFNPATDGYDYFTKVSVAEAELVDSISEAKLNIAEAKATVDVTSAGWTNADSYEVTLPTKTAPTTVDETVKTENINVTVTPAVGSAQTVTVAAGLYTSPVVIKVEDMADNEGAVVAASNITVKGAPKKVTVGEDTKFQVSVAVDKSGYIAAGDYVASNLDASSTSVSNTTDTVITSNSATVTTTAGYTEGETIALTVQEATTKVLATTGKLTVSTADTDGGQVGWYTGEVINVTDAVIEATADASSTVNYALVKDEANGTIAHTAGKYYKDVNLSDLVTELAGI